MSKGPELLASEDKHKALVPVWKQLISHPLPTNECVSLIMAIFSDRDELHEVNNLCGDDAQAFIDVIDEVGTFPLFFPLLHPKGIDPVT